MQKGVCKKEGLDSLLLADNGPIKGLAFIIKGLAFIASWTCQSTCEEGCLQERGKHVYFDPICEEGQIQRALLIDTDLFLYHNKGNYGLF